MPPALHCGIMLVGVLMATALHLVHRPIYLLQLERGNERRLQTKKFQADKKKERRAKIDW